MRSPLLLLLSLALGVSAYGQVQDRKLIDRIERPDKTMTYDLRKSSFGATRSYGVKEARVRDFGFVQRFFPGAFKSRSYSGTRAARAGETTYSTKDARLRGERIYASRTAPTKTMEVTSARDADKALPTGMYARAQRPYLGKESERLNRSIDPNAQGTVGWTGSMKPMTIDDVRELLNKNK